jgi:hypothetical protein
MANALIGIPRDFTVALQNGTADIAVANVLNDEPGLVFQVTEAAAGSFALLVTMTDAAVSIGSCAILGLNQSGWTIQYKAYANATDQSNDTNATYSPIAKNVNFSTNRSASLIKHVHTPTSPRTEKYWRITFTNGNGSSQALQMWRVLMCEKFQPEDNIEEGAQVTVDDRSERRYTRSGRRVIDPTVICPAFKGVWPWITAAEVHTLRKMMFQRAGSYPALFILDPADTTWGEDYVFYGDFEKDLTIDLNNNDLNEFKFGIVSIAP